MAGRPRKPQPPPPRREHGTGAVTWSEARQRYRARLPRERGRHRETWHRTRDAAEAWIARELARDETSFDASKSFGVYLNYWYQLHAPRWSEQTRRRYRYEIAATLPIGNHPLDRLRADHVQGLLSQLQIRKLTARYVYNIGALMRRALRDAVKWKILVENVADLVTLPEPERTVTRAWDLDEIRAVLSAIVGHRFEAVYLLILWAGLRIGEVTALRWDDIGADGTIVFELAEHSNLPGRPIGATKRRRLREAEVPAMVIARLKELRSAGPPPLAPPGRPKRAVAYVYVAQRPDGNRWTTRRIRDDWNEMVGKVRVGNQAVQALRPHGGRRTYGTLQMVSGTPLADLSALMGHSSPAITAQSYLGSSKARRRAAAERMADLIVQPKRTNEGQIEGQSVT